MSKEIISAIKQVQDSIEKLQIPDTVSTIPRPREIVFTKIKNLLSENTKKPDTADFEIENKHSIPLRLTSYSIIPNSEFKSRGNIIIAVGDGEHILFENDGAGDFISSAEYNHSIPNGLKINRGEKIKVYIWNGTNSASIACTVAFTLED